MEEWKDVKGYEGLYQVSNLGNVRSLDRRVKHSVYGYMNVKGKTLSQHSDGEYLKVKLSKDGKMKTHKVHRLVATAFIDNPNELPAVNHIDCDKFNNSVDNLEWCTISYNMQHAYNNGLCESCREASKQNIHKAYEACKKPVRCVTTGKEFKSAKEAADYYKVGDGSNIIGCCRGRLKSAGKLNGIKLRWEYI